VFTRTKHAANRLTKQLLSADIPSAVIHGNKSQNARQMALSSFKAGKTQVLVATDIAARGIDVEDISHVVNFDLPNETESYVHRIGRTGRAGASGIALSFCATDERGYLIDIERLIQMHIPVIADHPYRSSQGIPEPTVLDSTRRVKSNGGSAKAKQNGGGGKPKSKQNGSGNPRSNGGSRPKQNTSGSRQKSRQKH